MITIKKIYIAFSFGIALLTSIVLLTVQFYDRMLSEITTLDLLWVSIWGAVAGFATMSIAWILLLIHLRQVGRPKLYNISGGLFLLFAALLYILCRNITLAEMTMATFIAILVYGIFPVLLFLFLVSRKISLVFTFGVSFITFIVFLTVNYHDKMFLDLMTGDLIWYSIYGLIAGGLSLAILKLVTGLWGDLNLSGMFIFIFAIILFIHCGNIALWDVAMATFNSVLIIFCFFLIIGIYVITKLYKYQKDKRGGKWQ